MATCCLNILLLYHVKDMASPFVTAAVKVEDVHCKYDVPGNASRQSTVGTATPAVVCISTWHSKRLPPPTPLHALLVLVLHHVSTKTAAAAAAVAMVFLVWRALRTTLPWTIPSSCANLMLR
jgi:hypothetical protein